MLRIKSIVYTGAQKCGRALASLSARTFHFYILYFMHMNAVWQSLCVRY